jgi:OOP family OmpA-OmpF porin
MCNWKKWIWPGIFAVVILTALSTWFKADVVQDDLTAKALQDLQTEHSWADVSLDGRDLTLSGTAPSPEAAAAALQIADEAYDVRIVSDASDLLAIASPFALNATKSDGKVVLTGNVPSDDVRAEIVESAKASAPDATIDDQMTLARGANEGFADWAKFSIGELGGLTTGVASVSDADISVTGVASSFDSYDAAVANLAGTVPADGKVVEAEITPPTASPYEWMADYNGSAVTLSGFAPNADDRNAVEASVKEQLPEATITNNIRIAEGAPDNLSDAAKYATGFFPGFTQGRASFSDNKFSISGVAKSPAEFEAAQANIPNLTEGYELAENNIQPTGVSPYEWNASKDGQAIVLSGFAPGTAARDRIEENAKSVFPSATIDNQLKIAGGETAQYDPATGYSLDMLKNFSSGEAKMVDDNLTITGRAQSFEAYDAAIAAADNAPEGVSLNASVLPPIVKPYRFSAVKADNKITLSGYVQNDNARATAVSIAKEANPGFEVIDELRLADGVAQGVTWASATGYGIRQLGSLNDGNMSIIDGNYSISGNAASIEVRDAAVADIQAGLPGGMKLASEAISAPEPAPAPEPPAAPVADPYRWSVSKVKSGVSVSGNVADKADGDGIVSIVKSSLGVSDVTDKQTIASGKPDSFDVVRRIVTNQVKRLEAGQGNIIGQTVSVNGRASSEAIANEINSTISNALPVGYSGSTNILFPKPEPAPEPVVPTADPYRWSVSKQASGITVRGNVVDDATKAATVAMVNKTLGGEAADKQVIAQGKPDGFDDARKLVTSQVRLLEAGQGNVVGNTLSVSGRAKNENIKNLIDKIVQKRLPAGFTGTTNILFPKPEPAPAPAAPSVDADACQALIASAIDGQKILFETDKAVIKSDSEGVLDAVAKAANECPAVRMEIGGHTDSRGRDAYNQELSEARANAVKTYLANAGVDASRLDAKGYGETQPIASNKNRDGRAQNRRIEFNVIK